jgi:uncharacterized membrane protein (DUF4010 family)
MALILAATSVPVLQAMSGPLICAGVAAALYAAVFTIKVVRETDASGVDAGEAFNLPSALLLALTISGVLVISAALRDAFGEIGLVISAAVAGLADTHSPAVAVAALAASGKINPADAVIPVLMAMSTNTISKGVVAWTSGGRSFALRLIPGLMLVIAAAWAGAFGPDLLRMLS